ncbi:hypothetical protein [Halorussus halobius]|uniref:hypothetical protein n=1 Tax=Halorussus halobius TaxID=1710537 RepID=UPI001B2FFE51|nr:hypothetical protein [Halorussus halobius]
MSEHTYSVYLVERGSEQGGQRAITSPIEGHELEFYDAGVWLNRERGRNFFPYEQVRTVREHASEQPASPADQPVDGRESADRDPESGPGDAPAGTGRDQGAEEDLLE